MTPRYPHIIIERRDNGWSYVLQSSASTVTDAVHVDGSPLVLEFWVPKGVDGQNFILRLEEEREAGK